MVLTGGMYTEWECRKFHWPPPHMPPGQVEKFVLVLKEDMDRTLPPTPEPPLPPRGLAEAREPTEPPKKPPKPPPAFLRLGTCPPFAEESFSGVSPNSVLKLDELTAQRGMRRDREG